MAVAHNCSGTPMQDNRIEIAKKVTLHVLEVWRLESYVVKETGKSEVVLAAASVAV